jgi:hypothetical protein
MVRIRTGLVAPNTLFGPSENGSQVTSLSEVHTQSLISALKEAQSLFPSEVLLTMYCLVSL